MRHADGVRFLSHSISGLSPSVLLAALHCLLVPPPCSRTALSTRLLAAALRAVTVSAVAPRAQQHRLGAKITKESSTIRAQTQGTLTWTFDPKPETIMESGVSAPGPHAGDGYLPRKRRPPRFFLARFSQEPTTRAHTRDEDDGLCLIKKARPRARSTRFLSAAHTSELGSLCGP